MNLFTKLVISLITATIAAYAISHFAIQSTLQLWLLVASATLATTFLSQLKLFKPAAKKPATEKAQRKQKKPAKKSKPSQKSAAKASSPGESQGSSQGASQANASTSNGIREEGEVKWFNVSKGFGFIIRENGEEIFVHFRSIRGADSERRGLRDGQRVSFEVATSDKGPQAEEVEAL